MAQAPVLTETSTSASAPRARTGALVPYFLVGTLLGIVFTKAEIISWFRIQEMFRFQSFHMYGVIGAALAVAVISIQILKRSRAVSVTGAPITVPPKRWDGRGRRFWIGGTLFGMGWAMTGACPGPMYALVGNGILVFAVVLASAVAGTWTYGAIRDRLPHD